MELSYKELLHRVTTFIFDVDGVLTDGSVHITSNGDLHRTMNVKDGYALKEALNQGFNVCIISGGTDPGVRSRLENLGVQDIHLGVHHKKELLNAYLKDKNIERDAILYMGDDLPDYPVMREVGLATCPQDAVKEIKEISHYVSHKNGGKGCVRDIIEQVLKVQGKWMRGFDAVAH